jgi:rare lipoprotein A
MIMIENIHNGRKARCRVNDRGPYVKGRVIDVSRAVAKKLKMIKRGIAKVRLTVIKRR